MAFRHEGVQRLAGFFTAFVLVMAFSFVNLLRNYHRSDYSGSVSDVIVHQDPLPTAMVDLVVGAEAMADQLQRQIFETEAMTAEMTAATATAISVAKSAPDISLEPTPAATATSTATNDEKQEQPEKAGKSSTDTPKQEIEVKVETENKATEEAETTEKAETIEETEVTEEAEKTEKAEQKTPEGPSDTTKDPPKKRLNVALFYADDWTMKVLGKLDKHVKTPNIDEMADNGMLFTNNCVTTSVCWASRSTLATGTYTAVHKHTFPFQDADFETEHWENTLFPLMKNKDYFTGLFGKWHKLEIEDEVEAAFDKYKFYYGHHWEERDGKMRHVTELNKSDSLQYLKQWNRQRLRKMKKNEGYKPFFLTTSFFATHARDGEFPSYQPTNETRSSVYPDDLVIPKAKTATEEHWNDLPGFLRHDRNEGRTRWKQRFDPSNFQTSIKDMYAMATEVDEAVGAIIQQARNMGVYKETVFIFTTDNGNMHGEHGLAEKWYPFEESLRVPLVIQDPRMPKERRGTISEAWTLNVDLAPTILAVADIPPSDFMQGRDIADLYLNKDKKHKGLSNTEMIKATDWRTEWFYEFNLGKEDDASDHPWKRFIDASFALVTDEWKYVVWPQHDNYEQLFHRSVDPFDEWDLLNKILRPDSVKRRLTQNDSESDAGKEEDMNGPFLDTVQTTQEIYNQVKERYNQMKKKAQSGKRI
mmetsp:Transcript_1242/g.2647  ORF Transcript_1242/g.2647 Transcript_1242/m.2647 type:complete len:702 (-) Transcript_1242:126-2231(-)